ncbi:MAG TPA: rRNA maturation RNase YbeY [Candidatus Dorea intestinavium]|nr:rRNA maturation RNase YbeY [Candidatus Dorea intestinavium]
MNLLFEDESKLAWELDGEKIARDVISKTLAFLKVPLEVEVSLLITNSIAIKEMNEEFREIARATDVLSFPMNDYEFPEDFKDNEELVIDPDIGELLLGDIVINKEAVIAQAKEYGHSLLREYAFLIVHSVLHLIGYDHIIEEDRTLMEARQQEIMSFLNINR